MKASRMLALLPEAAAELLRAEDRTRLDDPQASVTFCSDITTEKARALAAVLADAGVRWGVPGVALSYWVAAGPRPGNGILIGFEPYLPHGEAACSQCG
jgi:hypothetical protein